MINKPKILIIDDSALMRRVMSDIILKDNRFTVQDAVEDGIQGLNLLIKNNGLYDVVLLDVNMPKMNGLDVLGKIQRYKLKCKVIMVSTLVHDGATETILALERGAFDFVLKPSADVANKMNDFPIKLLHSIELAAQSKEVDTVIKTESKNSIENKNLPSLGKNKLVAIACSTGGPKSLKEIIPFLPKNIDAPIIIVQHMPAGFTSSLANRLNELSEVTVKEAENQEILEKGHVYVAPGGKQFRIIMQDKSKHLVHLSDEAPQEGLKPCANIMYESLERTEFDYILCVVLTGMGSDGTNGIEKLSKSKKVHVIAQDAETSIVYGMPRSVVKAGLADTVLPLEKIAEEIKKNVGVLNNGR